MVPVPQVSRGSGFFGFIEAALVPHWGDRAGGCLSFCGPRLGDRGGLWRSVRDESPVL